MNYELTKEVIEKAINQNLLCFDANDTKNQLTDHLICILVRVCVDNCGGYAKKVYIPEEMEIDEEDSILKDHVENADTICGAIVIRDSRLNRNGEFRKIFDELKCIPAKDDKHFVVGVGDKCCILGSA